MRNGDGVRGQRYLRVLVTILTTICQSEFVAAGDRRIRGRLVLAQCDVPQGSQMMAGIASWEPPEPCKLPRAGWTAQANLESEDKVEVGSGVRDPLAVWLLCFANEPLKSFSRGTVQGRRFRRIHSSRWVDQSDC